MTFCPNCGFQIRLATEKFCPNCGRDLSIVADGRGQTAFQTEENKRGVSISGTHGDVIGTAVSGNNNTIGKNIVVGDGTIHVNEKQLVNLPNEYAQSLRTFSETINQELKGKKVPEDKVIEINDTINDFAKEVEDIKPGEEKNISSSKRRILDGKFGSLVRGVLTVLPTAATIGSSLFAPLAPFSSAIGESVEKVVADYLNE